MKELTSGWKCYCGTKNPLRYRECKGCKKAIPSLITNKIYHEEIEKQKAFFKAESFERETVRAEKISKTLNKLSNLAVILTLCLFIALTAGWVYMSQGQAMDNISSKIAMKNHRTAEQFKSMGYHFTNTQKIPDLITAIAIKGPEKIINIVQMEADHWENDALSNGGRGEVNYIKIKGDRICDLFRSIIE